MTLYKNCPATALAVGGFSVFMQAKIMRDILDEITDVFIVSGQVWAGCSSDCYLY